MENQSNQLQEYEKKIKLQDDNNKEITVPLQIIKDQIQNLGNALNNNYLNLSQQVLVNDIESVLKSVECRLKTIKEQQTAQNIQNLLEQGELNEDQFFNLFKQTIQTKVVYEYQHADLECSTEDREKEIEYSSTMFPLDFKLIQYVYYTRSYNESDTGQSKFVIQNKNDQQILFNFKAENCCNYQLDSEICKPTYNNDLVHVQNLKNFISKILDISSFNQKNINVDKLFDQFSSFFWSEQAEHSLGLEFEEEYLENWDDYEENVYEKE